MKLNVALGATLRGASINAIKQIDSNNLNLDNFIVVPDRFSFLAEKMVFEVLNIKSTFNIKVVSISKLANMVLNLAKIKLKQQNQIEGAMLVHNIMLNNANKLLSFKNTSISYDLAKDIYLTICQIKSSDVTAEQFLSSLNNLKSSKLQDIALIYKCYSEIERDKVDPNDVLNIFKLNIEESEIIKNSNFYFVEFDSLTKQSYEIFKLLVKCANAVTVACTIPTTFYNSHIFELDIKNKLDKVCEQLKIAPNIIANENNLNELQSNLLKNLFAVKKERTETKSIQLISEISEEKEVAKICNIINFNVKAKNKNFKDFNILVPNIETYKELLQKYCLIENIPYYLDKDYNFLDLVYAKFILKVLNFLNLPNEENYLNIASEKLSGLGDEGFNKINEMIFEKGLNIEQVLSSVDCEEIKLFNEKIKNINEKWKNISNFIEIEDVLKEIYGSFDFTEANIKIINYFKSVNDFASEKLYAQFEDKFNQCISLISNFNVSAKLTNLEKIAALEELFKAIAISCVPLSLDAIFIGQTNTSYFEQRKITIVMGAVDGKCPIYNKDIGLINDADINDLKEIEIEPSIKMINKRNKFKLFNDLLLTGENLIVTFVVNQKNKISELVEDLRKAYCINGKPLPIATDFFENNISDKNLKINKIIFEGASKNKKNNIKDIKKFEKSINFGKIMLKGKKTSISKLQKFYSCPFAHFAEFGLSLQEKDTAKLNAKDIGILFHNFAELLVQSYLKNQSTDVYKIFYASILKNERLKLLNTLLANKIIFKTLLKEAEVFASNLIKELNSTEFSVFKTEQFFSLPIKLENGEEISINGIVDRIDIYEDKIRIIDYKTGEMKLSISKLSDGQQIQLPIYALACEKLYKKICVGEFYFPIVSLNEKVKDKRLFGYFEKDYSIVKKFDKNLSKSSPKSEVLAITLSKAKSNDEIKFINRTGLLEVGELSTLHKYAELVAKKAAQEIFDGNIKCCPSELKNCKNCPYYALCEYDYLHETEWKNKSEKVTIQDLQNKLKEQGENNG